MPADALLCVVAHPDDEVRLTGGLLALLARRGVAVHVLTLTRGEGGELGEPPLATRETLGELREAEMVCAVQALGGRSLTFLDYLDPPVGPNNTLSAPGAELTVLAGQILNSVEQAGAQAVLTHGRNGEYGHPAHVLVHQACLAAVAAQPAERGLALYSFGASFPEHPYPRLANADDPADLVVDVTPVLARKIAASLCHRSQHALFVRRRSQEAGRPLGVEEVVSAETREGVRRQWPAGPPGPGDRLARWLGL